MASSKKNIILGVAVLAVWGSIGYKIVSSLQKSSVVDLPSTNVFKTAGIKVKKENFSIDASYRDPFLNEVKERVVKPTSDDIFSQKTKPQVRWPEIKYNGLVETSTKSKKVGLLQVNKKVFLVNDRDTTAKLQVVEIYKDSIRLKFSNEEKCYLLQKK